jgi:hypothetical protein
MVTEMLRQKPSSGQKIQDGERIHTSLRMLQARQEGMAEGWMDQPVRRSIEGRNPTQ